jgi:uncharacterized UPF0146 family protein
VSRSSDTLLGRLAAYDTLVEVGVGNRPDTAAALAERGCTITATDVHERPVPPGVTFVRDDVTDPDPAVYADADAVYARNCPPELQRPLADVAAAADADCLFTTLGGDPATVAVRSVFLPADRETLYVVA